MLKSLEICAGAGGQAIGLERAGFQHVAVVENDKHAAATLRLNRDNEETTGRHRWPVLEMDVHELDGSDYPGLDLFAGGVPCPPFSIAGKQLGADDERDLFPKALEIVRDAQPKAVLLENVRGLSSARFADYRSQVVQTLEDLGYTTWWQIINASEHGVAQLRPRFVLVAIKHIYAEGFEWPRPVASPPTVGEVLYSQMASNGWGGVDDWMERANAIGPTLVGGSKKHGGPDLGPTRAREAWLALGVDGRGLANEPPASDFVGSPRLTVPMAAAIQGFPDDWKFSGGKTASYRQVGNAFPPPVAEAIGRSIARALRKKPKQSVNALKPVVDGVEQ
ncbi:DNA cytosine methyltransferase [Salinibacterium sp. SWN248]|nr:DNA cytosine methyltransferase [Salinibacterium sp. SWN248]